MIAALLAAAAAPVLVCALYLALLALLAGEMADPTYNKAPKRRFAIVVPAHDEEANIARTVHALSVLDWPRELVDVVVVADNCADRTVSEAMRAGARVLARKDAARRGKGYALAFAFERILREGVVDAIVVIDADTIASPNILRAFDARLDHASCAQAEYGVRNPDASWRTRLMVLALALFHGVRSRARERLGLSTGLRGNGMCFSADLLRAVPYDAFSAVEDVEYGVALGLAGVRVAYAHDAVVLGEMVASSDAARSQRARWESGRARLARARALPVMGAALRRRNAMLFDLAMDLVVPPLSRLVFVALLGTLSALLFATWTATVPWLLSLSLVAGYVLRGITLAGPIGAGLRTLAWAPVYAAWKLTVRAAPRSAWIRTRREARGGDLP